VPDAALRGALQALVDGDPSPRVKEAARRALAPQP